MKRIILIILTVILGFSFAGCAAQTSTPSFDAEKPWGNAKYEKAVYDIQYTSAVSEKVIARGSMTYELRITSEKPNNIIITFVDLTMTASIEYEESDKGLGIEKGAVDTITSKVRFNNDKLISISSQKTITLAARTDSNGKFLDSDSYEVVANYSDSTATAYKGKKVDPDSGAVSEQYNETTEITLLNDTNIFDNEQLFYTIRALKGLELGATASLSISNIYEVSSSLDKKGKYNATGMSIAVSANHAVRNLNSKIASEFNLSPDGNGEYPVNCLAVSVAKSASPAGPPIHLYITDKEVTFENSLNTKTNRVIVGIQQAIYDITNRTVAYNIKYNLVDYTTT